MSTNSLFFSLNMFVVDIYYCLKLIVCDTLLLCVCYCYFTCSMFACNPMRLSLESIKSNLLTYLRRKHNINMSDYDYKNSYHFCDSVR